MNSLLEIQRTRFSFRYKSCIIHITVRQGRCKCVPSPRGRGEMVDAQGLGPCGATHGGSSPFVRTEGFEQSEKPKVLNAVEGRFRFRI